MAFPATSLLSAEMARAADALQGAISDGSDVPVFTWKGFDYPCIFKWVEQGQMNEGGIIPQDDLTLQVLVTEFDTFGSTPKRLDMITFQTRQFRIISIMHTPGNYIQFICADPAKGS